MQLSMGMISCPWFGQSQGTDRDDLLVLDEVETHQSISEISRIDTFAVAFLKAKHEKAFLKAKLCFHLALLLLMTLEHLNILKNVNLFI